MKTECPWCNQEYEVDEQFLNQTVLCEFCEKNFVIVKSIDLSNWQNEVFKERENKSKPIAKIIRSCADICTKAKKLFLFSGTMKRGLWGIGCLLLFFISPWLGIYACIIFILALLQDFYWEQENKKLECNLQKSQEKIISPPKSSSCLKGYAKYNIQQAMHMACTINESIYIARSTVNPEIKKERVKLSRQKVEELIKFAAENDIKLNDINDIENKISMLEKFPDTIVDREVFMDQYFTQETDNQGWANTIFSAKLEKNANHNWGMILDELMKMPIQEQCQNIGITLNEVTLNLTGRAESHALKYFTDLGYSGVAYEGVAVLTVLKACCYSILKKNNGLGDYATFSFPLEKLLIHQLDCTDKMIEEIEMVSLRKFKANLRGILQGQFMEYYPDLSVEYGTMLFKAMGRENLIKILLMLCRAPYVLKSGWPDLTLLKGNEVKFVEIKVMDKLHRSQLTTIPLIKSILPFEFSVLKVIPDDIPKKNQLDSGETIIDG